MEAARGIFEKLLISALLTNNKPAWDEALNYALGMRFSQADVDMCTERVERWLRLKGVVPMFPAELQALVRIQSAVRRWGTRRALWAEMDMFRRMALMDSPTHALRATRLRNVLTRTRKHVHESEHVRQCV